jgi:hypothetical protein
MMVYLDGNYQIFPLKISVDFILATAKLFFVDTDNKHTYRFYMKHLLYIYNYKQVTVWTMFCL